MSIPGARIAVVAVVLSTAAGAMGCLGGDDTIGPGGLPDAGVNLPDTSVPSSDASGLVDGAGRDATPDANDAAPPPPVDAGVDASDASPPDAAPPPDASGITGAAGLVPGGAVGKSKGYVLNGTVGPAAAPVLKSPSYRLVGGVAASTGSK